MMTRALLFLLKTSLLLSIFHSCTPQTGFQIKGDIEGIEAKSISLFVEYTDSAQRYSGEIIRGQFNIKGHVPHPCMATLYAKNKSGMHTKALKTFMIENTALYIQGTSIDNISVHGSASHNIYRKYKSQDDSLRKLWGKYRIRYDSLKERHNYQSLSKLKAKLNQIHCQERPALVLKYIKSYPKSYTVARIPIFAEFRKQFSPQHWERFYRNLDSTIQKSAYGQLIKARF